MSSSSSNTVSVDPCLVSSSRLLSEGTCGSGAVRVVIYTDGASGSGRLVGACSAALGCRRAGVRDVRIVCSHDFAFLAEAVGIPVHRVPPEGPATLTTERFRDSELYQTIRTLRPTVVVVVQSWYTMQTMTAWLDCPVVVAFRNASPEFFRLTGPAGEIVFDPEAFTRVVAWEPYDFEFETTRILPVILRNPDEVLSRMEAAATLGVDPAKSTALVAVNGHPGDFESLRNTYSYLDDEYQVIYSSNYHGGIFPAVDYFNAFDFLVCGAGYNQFWEAVYFDKDAVFEPVPTRFESQAWRVEKCQDYRFTENGADQLARIIANL